MIRQKIKINCLALCFEQKKQQLLLTFQISDKIRMIEIKSSTTSIHDIGEWNINYPKFIKKSEPISRKTAYFWIILFSFPAHVWRAFVGTTMWKWFAEPLGAPHINLIYGTGLNLMIMFYFFHHTKSLIFDQSKNGSELLRHYIGLAIIYPTSFLFSAWLIMLFL